jgi:hypothetical protein
MNIATPMEAFTASSMTVTANPNMPKKMAIVGTRHRREKIGGSASEESDGKEKTRRRPTSSKVIPRAAGFGCRRERGPWWDSEWNEGTASTLNRKSFTVTIKDSSREKPSLGAEGGSPSERR